MDKNYSGFTDKQIAYFNRGKKKIIIEPMEVHVIPKPKKVYKKQRSIWSFFRFRRFTDFLAFIGVTFIFINSILAVYMANK